MHAPSPRYTLRNLRTDRRDGFQRLDELYQELPLGAKIGNPMGLNGDRPVFFEGRAPFAHIEVHGTARSI
jgi:hypothetical protein